MRLFLRSLLIVTVLAGLLVNCAKWKVSPYDLLPQALTGTAATPATTSVSVQAQVGELGPNTLQEFGIVYSATNKTPTISDTKVPAAGTGGSASVTLNNLQPNTTYYYRTYATNNKNLTGYGEVKSFITAEVIAQVETLDQVGTPASTSAQVQCQVTNASSITLKEYGINYSTTNQNPVQGTKVQAVGGKGEKVTLGLTGLQTNTTYYYQAYAITGAGTPSYGAVKSFKTGEVSPVAETLDLVGSPGSTSAQVQCQVPNASSISLKEYGVVYSTTNQNPLQGSKAVAQGGKGEKVTLGLTGLQTNTTYYYQAYATSNSGLTSNGTVKSFKTGENLPIAETLDPVGTPASTSAQVQGQVTNAGTVTLKEYGIVYSSTNPQPTVADGIVKATGSGGVTTVTLTGLQPNTQYNYRTYAINGEGTVSYSSTIKTFKTQNGWVPIASFPGVARSETGVFVIGSKAYIIGGLTGVGSTGYSNEVWEYDATTNKWTQKNNIPRRIAYGKGFSYNGSGYLVGYTDEARTAYGELLVYNQATDQWTTLTNAGLKRILINLAVLGNKVYIAGGQDQNSIIEYNIDAKTTRTITTTPLTNLLVGVMFPNGSRVYIGNGLFYSTNSQTKSAFEFSPSESDKFSNKPDMPQTQVIGAAIANNRTFAVGTTDSRLFEYKNDLWSLVDLPIVISPRGGGAFFSIGNTIYYGFGYPNFPSAEPTNRKVDMWAISF